MEISKAIFNKMQRLKNIREKANNLEHEIMQWFESKGIDTSDDNFANNIGSHITYGEFDSIDDINECLERYFNDKRR